MTCAACDRALTRPRTGWITAGCQGCEARSLAQGPEAFARDADPQPLQAAMRRVWPSEDAYRKGRALVWEWIGKFTEAKACES